jgi:hypothetical protein
MAFGIIIFPYTGAIISQPTRSNKKWSGYKEEKEKRKEAQGETGEVRSAT